MAFTAKNGERITKRQLQQFARAIERGERSRIEIERTELGDQTSRGKYLSRAFDAEGITLG